MRLQLKVEGRRTRSVWSERKPALKTEMPTIHMQQKFGNTTVVYFLHSSVPAEQRLRRANVGGGAHRFCCLCKLSKMMIKYWNILHFCFVFTTSTMVSPQPPSPQTRNYGSNSWWSYVFMFLWCVLSLWYKDAVRGFYVVAQILSFHVKMMASTKMTNLTILTVRKIKCTKNTNK